MSTSKVICAYLLFKLKTAMPQNLVRFTCMQSYVQLDSLLKSNNYNNNNHRQGCTEVKTVVPKGSFHEKLPNGCCNSVTEFNDTSQS
jgi:hypothetical protein